MIDAQRLERLLERLWEQYKIDCPYAAEAEKLYPEASNDHIAFRSVNVGAGKDMTHGIDPIKSFWEQFGYKEREKYLIEEKNIRAIHMDKKGFPKIFISEFRTEFCEQEEARRTINNAFGICHRDVFAASEPRSNQRIKLNPELLSISELANFFFLNPYPLMPTHQELKDLGEIDQYVAWVRCFGNMVNHFTLDVSTIKDRSYDIEFIANEMKEAGIPMQDKVEGIGTELAQTSTTAHPKEVVVITKRNGTDHTLGVVQRPYAYYEVAERGMVVFDGFKAEQTKGLFDVTKEK